MQLDLHDDESTLVQLMAWCRQATSHYLSQCWPRSMLPNGVTRPQWVKISLAHLNSDFNYFSYTLQSGLAISSGPRKKEISMEKNAPEETGFFHPYQKKWNKLKLVEYIYFCILIIFPERKLSLIFSLNRKKCHLQKFIIWFIIYTLPFQWFFLEKLKNCHYNVTIEFRK